METRLALWHGNHDPPTLGLTFFLEFGEVRPRLQGEAINASFDFLSDPQNESAEKAAPPKKSLFGRAKGAVASAGAAVKNAVKGSKQESLSLSKFTPTGEQLQDGDKVVFDEKKSEEDQNGELQHFYRVANSQHWIKGSESLQVISFHDNYP